MLIRSASERTDFTLGLLHIRGIEHRVYDHPDVSIVDHASDQEARLRYGMEGHPSKSVLVVEARTEIPIVVFTVPEKRRIDWRRFAEDIGRPKVRIASEEQLRRLTGCEPGALVPIGLDPAIPLFLDEAVRDHEKILLSVGGLTTRTLEIRTADLGRLIRAGGSPCAWTVVPELA